MTRKPASDEAYRQAWAAEIEIGCAKGKLTAVGKRADLRTVSMSPEDRETLNRMHGK